MESVVRFFERWQRPLRVLVGLTAITLGYWGWSIHEPAADWNGWFDNLFRTLQLITLQFPREIEVDIPWQLQIARFLMPVLAAAESFRLLSSMVRNPLGHASVPFARDHVVVLGNTPNGRAVMRAYGKSGRRVVGVGSRFDELTTMRLTRDGVVVVEADLRDRQTMEYVRIRRAEMLFVLGESDVLNLNVAMVAMDEIKRRAGRGRFDLVVGLDDENLAEQIDAAVDGISRDSNVRYHRISARQMGVRLAFDRYRLPRMKASPSDPTHLLISGFGPGAATVLRVGLPEIQDAPKTRPILTFLVSASERISLAAWLQSKPDIPLVAEVKVLEVLDGAHLPSETLLEEHLRSCPPVTLAFVCRDDAQGILAAIALRRSALALARQEFPIHIHQSKYDVFFSTVRTADVRQVDMTRMFAFGGRIPWQKVLKLRQESDDSIAKAIHQRYLKEAADSPSASAASRLGWDELSENVRDANRAAAWHAKVKLDFAGFRMVAAKNADGDADEFDPETIEMLAEMEHRRWCAERILSGWHFGPVRDDLRQLHPSIVPYASLSEGEKAKDRTVVKMLRNVAEESGCKLEKVAYVEVSAEDLESGRHTKFAAGNTSDIRNANKTRVPVVRISQTADIERTKAFVERWGSDVELELTGPVIGLIKAATPMQRANLFRLLDSVATVRRI